MKYPLFACNPRTYDDIKPDGVPYFEYLDLCSSSEASSVRRILNKWYHKYPDEEKGEWLSRFKSANESDRWAAYFELYVHSLLISLGYKVTVHPSMPNKKTRPDFYAEGGEGDSFYLEAKYVQSYSDRDMKARRTIMSAIEALRMIGNTGYFLVVKWDGLPNAEINARSMKKQVETWLNNLDYCADDKVEENEDLNRNTISIEVEGCMFRITARAYHEFIVGSQNHGIDVEPFEPVPYMRDRLVKALKNKAGVYGDMGKPYAIAVLSNEVNIDDNNYLEALFGKRRGSLDLRTGRIMNEMFVPPALLAIKRGGSYVKRYTRVSAIIGCSQV